MILFFFCKFQFINGKTVPSRSVGYRHARTFLYHSKPLSSPVVRYLEGNDAGKIILCGCRNSFHATGRLGVSFRAVMVIINYHSVLLLTY